MLHLVGYILEYYGPVLWQAVKLVLNITSEVLLTLNTLLLHHTETRQFSLP